MPSLEDAIESARALVADGITVSDAARQIADLSGVPRREIYETLLRDQASS